MLSSPDFAPDWTSPPGATIAEILKAQSMSTGAFAHQLGQSEEEVQELLQGRKPITVGLARALTQTLGASVEFWVARDFQYRSHTRHAPAEKDWLATLPLGDMIRFGWVSPPPLPEEEVDACLRFFDVPIVQAWRDSYLLTPALAAFRTSASFDSRPAAVAAWLRQGTILGTAMKCDPWNREGFLASLDEARALTRIKEPSRYLLALRECCAKNGVAVAIVRTPAGCRASGATSFLSRHKALILLSFRYRSDDHFWFTFFHEAAHLVLHGEDSVFIDGEPTPTTSEEQEANEFAGNVLIPPEYLEEMTGLPVEGRAVIRFARRIGVSPGIVVGQMQHAGRLNHKQLNSLKRRFQWPEEPVNL